MSFKDQEAAETGSGSLAHPLMFPSNARQSGNLDSLALGQYPDVLADQMWLGGIVQHTFCVKPRRIETMEITNFAILFRVKRVNQGKSNQLFHVIRPGLLFHQLLTLTFGL